MRPVVEARGGRCLWRRLSVGEQGGGPGRRGGMSRAGGVRR
ncbi:hypothetical protein SSCG_04748 [Streptomyces clavuligerus]|nr:hypothetical protein SSCG_04748 [Streptomyces clavuligerus]